MKQRFYRFVRWDAKSWSPICVSSTGLGFGKCIGALEKWIKRWERVGIKIVKNTSERNSLSLTSFSSTFSLSFFSFNILRESKSSNNKYESLYSQTREVEISIEDTKKRIANHDIWIISARDLRDLILPFISSSIIFLSFSIDPPLPSFFLFTPIQFANP